MLITVNVVLEKSGEKGAPSSYSCFYGECYDTPQGNKEDTLRGSVSASAADDEEDDRQSKTQICERFRARTVVEFRERFPERIEPQLAIEKFARALEDSAVSVHSLINVVVLFFKIVTVDELPRDTDLSIPRIAEAH